MGLSFQAGTFAYVWKAPYDAQLTQAVEQASGYVCTPADDYSLGYCSEGVAWSGWGQLQATAISVLGQDATPHLQAVEAWKGVYLPIDIAPCEVHDAFNDTPLRCGSLPHLIEELERFAAALSLPIEEAGLQARYQLYMEADELADADMEIQTYIQVLLTARVAVRQNLPLWVIK